MHMPSASESILTPRCLQLANSRDGRKYSLYPTYLPYLQILKFQGVQRKDIRKFKWSSDLVGLDENSGISKVKYLSSARGNEIAKAFDIGMKLI